MPDSEPQTSSLPPQVLAFPHPFPQDLEREIMEHAACMFPSFIPTLLLVSHRVHHWVEPFLYEKICLDGRANGTSQGKYKERITAILEASERPQAFSRVRSVCLTHSMSCMQPLPKRILSAASHFGLNRLCIWMSNLGSDALLPLVTAIHVAELAVEVTFFYRLLQHALESGRKSWLDGLTHVQLMFWNDFSPIPSPKTNGVANPYTLLCSLTHISMAVTVGDTKEDQDEMSQAQILIDDYFGVLETLEMIVIILHNAENCPHLPGLRLRSKAGKQVVCIEEKEYSTESWDDDSPSIWEDAEKVLNAPEPHKMATVGTLSDYFLNE